jgi:hypothetical protein
MFKILKSLSKSLGGSKSAEAKPAAKPGSLLDKVNKGAPCRRQGGAAEKRRGALRHHAEDAQG